MSLMSQSQLNANRAVRQTRMTDTCTTQRALAPVADDYGQPTKSFSSYLTNQICFFEPIIQRRGGEQLTQEREFTADRYKLEMPVGTDVVVTDQVTNIVDAATGTPKAAGNPTYQVKNVVQFLTFLEVSLEVIN